MRELFELLRVGESALTADFRREYGLWLSDTIRDRELDEVLDLIAWLHPGAAFHAVHEYPHDLEAARQIMGWTLVDEIHLQTLNAVHSNTFATVQVQSTRKLPEPKMIDGPRQVRKHTDANDANAIARRMMAEAGKAENGDRRRGSGEGDSGPEDLPHGA